MATDATRANYEGVPRDAAWGLRIGPIERRDALTAIRAQRGPVIVDYPEHGIGGGVVRRVVGYVHELGVCEYGEHSTVFAFVAANAPPVALGDGMLFPAAAVLDLAPDGWTAERDAAGLDLHLLDGDVRLVFCQPALATP